MHMGGWADVGMQQRRARARAAQDAPAAPPRKLCAISAAQYPWQPHTAAAVSPHVAFDSCAAAGGSLIDVITASGADATALLLWLIGSLICLARAVAS